MSDLFDKYGYVELSVGDLLWHENDRFPDITRETFFLTDTRYAMKTYGEKLYEFIVTKPIKLLTPFKVTKQTRANSEFCQIYNYISKNSTYSNNVAFKNNIKRRRDLITWLRTQGIDGWVSPIERTLYELEVCLFTPFDYVEPNCTLQCTISKETRIKGFVGTCNTLNIGSFLKARKENTKYNKSVGLVNYSLYDHYII